MTDRGEIIAELGPPGHGSSDSSLPAGLLALAKRGLLTGWRAAGPERLRRAPPFTQAQTIGVPASRRGARPAVNLYAESSAILAWLLGEEEGTRVRRMLADAEIVVASDLTVIECDRVLLRGTALGELTEADAADRRAYLTTAVSHWHVMRIGRGNRRSRPPAVPGRTDPNARCHPSGVGALRTHWRREIGSAHTRRSDPQSGSPSRVAGVPVTERDFTDLGRLDDRLPSAMTARRYERQGTAPTGSASRLPSAGFLRKARGGCHRQAAMSGEIICAECRTHRPRDRDDEVVADYAGGQK